MSLIYLNMDTNKFEYDFLVTHCKRLQQKIAEIEKQKEWISEELAPALNKCFKSKIGCDGMLMVAVDDYNELVDLINKAAQPKEQGQ